MFNRKRIKELEEVNRVLESSYITVSLTKRLLEEQVKKLKGERQMTNFEFYKNDILKSIKEGSLAVVNNKPCSCFAARCSECDFGDNDKPAIGGCDKKRFKWLYSEAEE